MNDLKDIYIRHQATSNPLYIVIITILGKSCLEPLKRTNLTRYYIAVKFKFE